MKSRIKTILSSSIRTFISVFFIVLLLYIMRGEYPQILKAFASTKVPIFIAGLLLFVSAISVASVRFELLIKAQDIPVKFMVI